MVVEIASVPDVYEGFVGMTRGRENFHGTVVEMTKIWLTDF